MSRGWSATWRCCWTSTPRSLGSPPSRSGCYGLANGVSASTRRTFFARRTDGTGVVIDVRPDDRVDPEAAEVFEVAASACSEAGWEFRRTGAPPAVLTANVRWLAGYRNPRCHRPEIADALIERFAAPMPLFTGAAAVGDRLVVLPVLYHLLWRQVLVVDLAAAPLSPGSLIHLAAAAR